MVYSTCLNNVDWQGGKPTAQEVHCSGTSRTEHLLIRRVGGGRAGITTGSMHEPWLHAVGPLQLSRCGAQGDYFSSPLVPECFN